MAEIITELSQKQRMTIWTKMNHIVEKLISDIETTGFTENVVTFLHSYILCTQINVYVTPDIY